MFDFFGIPGIQFMLCSIMLGIATLSDFKKREISDLIWIIFGIIGVALIFVQPEWFDSLFSVGISLIIAPIVLLLWRFGIFDAGYRC